MPETGTSGLMSGERKRNVAAWPKSPRLSSTLLAHPGYKVDDLTTSLRGAKRRSNPSFPLQRYGLLRFARSDGRENGTRREVVLFSLRLLPQRRMRPSEIRRCRILADLDDAAADGAGAGEILEQRFAVVAADRARQL